MMRFYAWAVGLLVFSGTASAFAQDAGGDKNIKLGLRLGYALPMGDVTGASTVGGLTIPADKLSDSISGQIPIWIDAGYMVTPNVLLGLYAQYGFAMTKNCPTGASCSAHDTRFGVQGQYHLSPQESLDPWLGLGVGYEILSASDSGNGESIDVSIKGFEFLNLQGGADFKVADAFTVGPFLSFSLGKYASETVGGTSQDIPTTAFHEWLTLGAKGTFGL